MALLLLSLLAVFSMWSGTADDAATLTLAEAKILVYVTPVGDRARRDGLDIALELQTSAQLNQADYYYFWVYNAKREQSSGSVTIGYFAVNKHTAEVWDTDTKKQISSDLVVGVQKIVRDFHHIDEPKIEKYWGRPF
jgi:hypothetical protein